MGTERGADRMGANRALRRKQTREKMQEWVRTGEAEKVRILSANGIRPQDLDEQYKKGYEEGWITASEAFLRKMYAAIAKELIEAGNDRDEVVSFVKGVDHRFAVMFDAEEEIEAVYDQIGVRFNVDRTAIERVEVTRV